MTAIDLRAITTMNLAPAKNGQTAGKIGSCLVKGAVVGAVGALAVGGLAVGAVTLGAPAAIAMRATRRLHKHGWYWAAAAASAVLQVPFIRYVPWSNHAFRGTALLPFGPGGGDGGGGVAPNGGGGCGGGRTGKKPVNAPPKPQPLNLMHPPLQVCSGVVFSLVGNSVELFGVKVGGYAVPWQYESNAGDSSGFLVEAEIPKTPLSVAYEGSWSWDAGSYSQSGLLLGGIEKEGASLKLHLYYG